MPEAPGFARVAAPGILRFADMTCRAALGQGGIRADKQEGDGATPAALMPLRRVLYRADRLPPFAVQVPREPLAPADGWCDDVADAAYNCQIRLPHAARHEELWRNDQVYDVIGVLGWNDAPVMRGRGSAIFLHVARPDYAPTEGCVALSLPDLLALLARGCQGIDTRL